MGNNADQLESIKEGIARRDAEYSPLSKSGKNMCFGQAVHYAKAGHKIARAGWNGAGMFAYIVPAAKYKAQTTNMIEQGFDGDLVPYREYWALFTAQKDVAMWAPSGSDSLANDWMIVE